MSGRGRAVFLALVLAQAAHSAEEYLFRLYDVFAPARMLSGLVADDLRAGFLGINIGLVLFGLACWLFLVRPGRPLARAVAWFWVALEGANGIAHLTMAVARGDYFPGVATAPLLAGFALWLALELTRSPGPAEVVP